VSELRSAPLAPRRRWRGLAVLGPGLLVAATGVGAGDLATGAFSGQALGVAVLWAVLAGAALKLALNEGLARWQLATGQTVLEGALLRLGRPARWLFLAYLLPWSWFVGSALASACGATAHALIPVFDDAGTGKIAFGLAASALGLLLVERGGFALFEVVMRACIGVMFAVVVTTALLLAPDWGAVARGLLVPTIPDAGGRGLGWTVALFGGVGGTLTVLCYGYWMREAQRDTPAHLAACRLDLAISYAMTALFGVAMVIIGSTLQADLQGQGAALLVHLADRLVEPLGPAARWMFLVGAFGAVFSSLLGVWQSVPYIFADFWGIARGAPPGAKVDPKGRAYRAYLYALALVPALGLWLSFERVQQAYAVVGAAFLPLLALALLLLNGRADWVGARMRNGPLSTAVLVAALLAFAAAGVLGVS
jgi:Mn2+/Fe2+ NRAMP family transporter